MTMLEALQEEISRLMTIEFYGEENIGLHERHALFVCETPADVDSAIAICGQWAKGKNVAWTTIPIRTDRDCLRERGYLGVKMVDYDVLPRNLQVIRSAMLGEDV